MTEMNDDDVILTKSDAEQIEAFLRMLANNSMTEEDLLAFRREGLIEAADVFADCIEAALEQMRSKNA